MFSPSSSSSPLVSGGAAELRRGRPGRSTAGGSAALNSRRLTQERPPGGSAAGSPPLALAVAVLLVDIQRADGHRGMIDRASVRRELQRLVRVDCLAAARLILDAALRESARATSLAPYTDVIASAFSLQQRFALIGALWRIAYLHGATAAGEPYLERVAGLIGVPGEASSVARGVPHPVSQNSLQELAAQRARS